MTETVGKGGENKGAGRRAIPWLLLARLALGGIFIYSSADKILHPGDFARAVYNYQILPRALINLAAIALPWAELALGLCLVTGVWLPGAALFTNLLLWAFFAALLVNQVRGIDVHCGCFSSRPDPASPPPTAWYLVRDSVFLLLGGSVFFRVFLKPRAGKNASPAADGQTPPSEEQSPCLDG
jgi:uncharacterized membrane protein YphA (DoxX/SURF4 family)